MAAPFLPPREQRRRLPPPHIASQAPCCSPPLPSPPFPPVSPERHGDGEGNHRQRCFPTATPSPSSTGLPPAAGRSGSGGGLAAATGGSGGGSLHPRQPQVALAAAPSVPCRLPPPPPNLLKRWRWRGRRCSSASHCQRPLAGSGHGRRWRLLLRQTPLDFWLICFFLSPFAILLFLYLGSNMNWIKTLYVI